jgi:hypothetical protein
MRQDNMGRRKPKTEPRGVRVADARRLLLTLPNVVEGFSYRMPSFLLNGRFLARFRDNDEVLVLQLESIDERDVLMQIDAETFFFTDHYRNYPAVLVRLANVPRALLSDVITGAWRHLSAKPPARPRAKSGRSRRSPRPRAVSPNR